MGNKTASPVKRKKCIDCIPLNGINGYVGYHSERKCPKSVINIIIKYLRGHQKSVFWSLIDAKKVIKEIINIPCGYKSYTKTFSNKNIIIFKCVKLWINRKWSGRFEELPLIAYNINSKKYKKIFVPKIDKQKSTLAEYFNGKYIISYLLLVNNEYCFSVHKIIVYDDLNVNITHIGLCLIDLHYLHKPSRKFYRVNQFTDVYWTNNCFFFKFREKKIFNFIELTIYDYQTPFIKQPYDEADYNENKLFLYKESKDQRTQFCHVYNNTNFKYEHSFAQSIKTHQIHGLLTEFGDYKHNTPKYLNEHLNEHLYIIDANEKELTIQINDYTYGQEIEKKESEIEEKYWFSCNFQKEKISQTIKINKKKNNLGNIEALCILFFDESFIVINCGDIFRNEVDGHKNHKIIILNRNNTDNKKCIAMQLLIPNSDLVTFNLEINNEKGIIGYNDINQPNFILLKPLL